MGSKKKRAAVSSTVYMGIKQRSSRDGHTGRTPPTLTSSTLTSTPTAAAQCTSRQARAPTADRRNFLASRMRGPSTGRRSPHPRGERRTRGRKEGRKVQPRDNLRKLDIGRQIEKKRTFWFPYKIIYRNGAWVSNSFVSGAPWPETCRVGVQDKNS